MRSRSLHHPADWIKFLTAPRARTVWRRVAERLRSKQQGRWENDTGTGSAGPDAGADLRTHISHRSVVEDAARGGRWPYDLGGIRHGARVHRPLVLRAAVPLPDPVLLAVRQRRVRTRVEQPGALVAGHTADHPVRGRVAGVRARLPADVLLLPRGLLPGVLAGTGRVRGTRAAREVHRRDQGAADRAESAPLPVLRGRAGRDPAHL